MIERKKNIFSTTSLVNFSVGIIYSGHVHFQSPWRHFLPLLYSESHLVITLGPAVLNDNKKEDVYLLVFSE